MKKYEKEKGSHSVVKEARVFAREIDLDLENARKLKRIARKRERRLLILPESQNLYMVNTLFKVKKLMYIYMTLISG